MNAKTSIFCHGLFLLIAWAGVASAARADYTSVVLGDSPIGYWRLGEAADAMIAQDASGNNRNLNYTLFSSGLYGHPGAIRGDGDASIRFIPTPGPNASLTNPSTHPTIISPNTTDFAFALGQSFSLEYWIKAAPGNASSDGAGIVTKGYDLSEGRPWYLSRYLAAGRVDFFVRTGANQSFRAESAAIINDNRWHHVVGVYDAPAAALRLYVDGTIAATAGGVIAAAFGTNNRPLTIGNHFNRALDANVDEVAIYDQALRPAQVQYHSLFATVPRDSLHVDFGNLNNIGGGPGGIQGRYFALEGVDGGAPLSLAYPTTLGTSDWVDVSISGYTHFRDYAAVTGGFAPASPLISDMVLRNADGTMSLALGNLKPGTYQITTFHHSSAFGGGAFDVTLWDAMGSGQSVASGVPVSAGTDPASVSTLSFPFIVGNDAVQIDFHGGANSQHLSLNGFSLERVSDLPVVSLLKVDFNDRSAAEAGVPGVTKAGFQEFLLEGEPVDVTTPTTRNVGPYAVTVSSPTGQTMSDRRRTSPADGGFVSDQELLRDFIFARGTTPDDGLDILIEGLTPGALHEVTVWGYDVSSQPNRISNWFANGELVYEEYAFNGANLPGFDDTYRFSFRGHADPNGVLRVSGRYVAGANPAVFINAIEVAHVVPEPGALVLAIVGFGLLPLVHRGRRQTIQD
jgi:hypothetical protein